MLQLDKELREIEAGLKRSLKRDQFQLKQKWAVPPIDLRRAVLEQTPQIVHFFRARSDLACPAIEDQLLTTYFSYFIRTGFLPNPHNRSFSLGNFE